MAAKKKYAKKPNGKAATGRPSKKDSIHYEGLKLCYSKGFSDEETALALQITQQTLNNWKKSDPKFFEALKDWKLQADEKVERSLFERATGFKCPETKAQWVSDIDGSRWEYAKLEKIYPPDTAAATLWLKNRKPDVWRDVQHHKIDGLDGLADRIKESRGKN